VAAAAAALSTAGNLLALAVWYVDGLTPDCKPRHIETILFVQIIPGLSSPSAP